MMIPLPQFQAQRDQMIALVVNGLNSDRSKRAYREALTDFLNWHRDQPDPTLTKALVNGYKAHLRTITSARTGQPLSSSTVNLRLCAVRRLAREAEDNDLIDPVHANGIKRVEGVTQKGTRIGNWLSKPQAQALLDKPDPTTLKGLRDRAILAVLLGCALRREEAANLTVELIQQREGHWVIVDLVGKLNKIRSVPMPSWVKAALDDWTAAAGIASGPIWRGMRKGDRIIADPPRMSTQAVWRIVSEYATAVGFPALAPHDLRRTAAKLMLAGGAPLEQISLILGHSSLDVTKRYLGVELDLQDAATDRIGLKIKAHQKPLPGV
jgi:integrase